MLVPFKTCTKCGIQKPLEEFGKDKKRKDGHVAQCKECLKAYRKEYHKKNKDKENAKNKEWYLKNKESKDAKNKLWREEHKDYMKEYHKKHYLNNKEYYNNKSKQWYNQHKEHANYLTQRWYESNKDHVKELRKAWVKQNKEKLVLSRNNRKAYVKMLPNTLTKQEWDSILSDFNKACALTGTTEKVTLEHFIPLSCGHGGTCLGNVYPLNASLNFSKQDKNPFEWFEANKDHFKLNKEAWDSLVTYLATQNNMSVDEFRTYVCWCFENPVKAPSHKQIS